MTFDAVSLRKLEALEGLNHSTDIDWTVNSVERKAIIKYNNVNSIS